MTTSGLRWLSDVRRTKASAFVRSYPRSATTTSPSYALARMMGRRVRVFCWLTPANDNSLSGHGFSQDSQNLVRTHRPLAGSRAAAGAGGAGHSVRRLAD